MQDVIVRAHDLGGLGDAEPVDNDMDRIAEADAFHRPEVLVVLCPRQIYQREPDGHLREVYALLRVLRRHRPEGCFRRDDAIPEAVGEVDLFAVGPRVVLGVRRIDDLLREAYKYLLGLRAVLSLRSIERIREDRRRYRVDVLLHLRVDEVLPVADRHPVVPSPGRVQLHRVLVKLQLTAERVDQRALDPAEQCPDIIDAVDIHILPCGDVRPCRIGLLYHSVLDHVRDRSLRRHSRHLEVRDRRGVELIADMLAVEPADPRDRLPDLVDPEGLDRIPVVRLCLDKCSGHQLIVEPPFPRVCQLKLEGPVPCFPDAALGRLGEEPAAII